MTKRLIFILILGLETGPLAAKEKNHLPAPTLKSSIDRISEVHSLLITPESIWSVSTDEKAWVKSPIQFSDDYHNPKNKLLPKRFSGGETLDFSSLRLGSLIDKRIYAMDAKDITITVVGEDKGVVLVRRSVPYDQLRPARDSVGEATQSSQRDFKLKFLKSWKKIRGSKVVSLRKDNKRSSKTYHRFLILTRSLVAPILIMDCKKSETGRCEVVRGCTIKDRNWSKLKPTGLALSPDSNSLWVSFAGHQQVVEYSYSGCLNIRKKRSVFLPLIEKKTLIREPYSLDMSKDGSLWLGTLTPDNYLNATIYRWLPEDLK